MALALYLAQPLKPYKTMKRMYLSDYLECDSLVKHKKKSLEEDIRNEKK